MALLATIPPHENEKENGRKERWEYYGLNDGYVECFVCLFVRVRLTIVMVSAQFFFCSPPLSPPHTGIAAAGDGIKIGQFQGVCPPQTSRQNGE